MDMLTEEDEQNVDIAVAAAVDMIEKDGGVDALRNVVSGNNPAKMLALFVTQMIEALYQQAGQQGFELSPAIWMAEGGVIDELADEFSDILDQDVTQLMAEAKPIIMQNVQKRAEGAQETGEQAPPMGEPAEGQMGPPEMQQRPAMARMG